MSVFGGAFSIKGITLLVYSASLIVCLGYLVGHFGHVGPVDVNVSLPKLKGFRELVLVLFLMGAGVSGGMRFAQYFKWDYFFYGIVITVVGVVISSQVLVLLLS